MRSTDASAGLDGGSVELRQDECSCYVTVDAEPGRGRHIVAGELRNPRAAFLGIGPRPLQDPGSVATMSRGDACLLEPPISAGHGAGGDV
jgi:hypothetical protein